LAQKVHFAIHIISVTYWKLKNYLIMASDIAVTPHPMLHRFQAICVSYGIDPLPVCELLRLLPVPRNLLREFRQAYREEGVTPLQALLDFMRVYCRQGIRLPAYGAWRATLQRIFHYEKHEGVVQLPI
jgi:hypothetical protein